MTLLHADHHGILERLPVGVLLLGLGLASWAAVGGIGFLAVRLMLTIFG